MRQTSLEAAVWRLLDACWRRLTALDDDDLDAPDPLASTDETGAAW